MEWWMPFGNPRDSFSPFEQWIVDSYEAKFPDLKPDTDKGKMCVWAVAHMLTLEGMRVFRRVFPIILDRSKTSQQFKMALDRLWDLLIEKYDDHVKY
jgi:hypothetical protein